MAKKVKTPSAKGKADIKALNGEGKSSARISGLINEIGMTSKELHAKIALTAALCVIHATMYGDVTLATRLITKMGPGMRANDMRDWFIAKGPFRWGDTKATDKEGKKIKGFLLHKERQAELILTMQDAAGIRKVGSDLQKNSMWVWKKEPKYTPFNFIAQLESLVKRNETKAKEADIRDNVIDMATARTILANAKEAEAKKLAAKEVAVA